MTFFRLSADSILVKGNKGSALYDVSGRRLILLEECAAEILRECEKGKPLREEWRQSPVHRFLNLLVAEALGFYYTHPVYIDKLEPKSPIVNLGEMFAPSPNYRGASWSITSHCDHACAFCPRAPGLPVWQACWTCVRRLPLPDAAGRCDSVEDTVAQLVGLGVGVLHVRGGNPFLEWERLKNVAVATAKTPLDLMVTTPGTGQPLHEVARLYDLQPKLALNIVLDAGKLVCDSGGDVPDSQRTLVKLLDVLAREQRAFSVTLFFFGIAPNAQQQAVEFVHNRWGTEPHLAQFGERRAGPGTISQAPQVRRKRLSCWSDIRDLTFRRTNNLCLTGWFEISADGALRPCAGCDHDCGTITDGQRLLDVLKNPCLYDVWAASKDSVKYCRECPLRFACADCHATATAGSEETPFAAAQCPLQPPGVIPYDSPQLLQHDGFVYRLSVAEGLVQCELTAAAYAPSDVERSRTRFLQMQP